jgi:exonuclease III
VKKIAAILSLQSTIIFLSDLRLNTNNTEFNNYFYPRYEFFHNSTESRRGVGILISNKLQYTLLQSYTDLNNNILGLRLLIGDTEILLVSIYGPNKNDFKFFQDIRSIIQENKNLLVICGGDWNTTFSTAAGELNLDTFAMLNPPSIVRSNWLNEICDDFNLTDPFRSLNFAKRDFTYIPRSGTRNRSRIDFF